VSQSMVKTDNNGLFCCIISIALFIFAD